MTIHENEIPVDEALVRALLKAQRPEWAELPLRRAGAGTDNNMFRLGDELLVRVPRTAEHAPTLVKEREWLPRLGAALSWPIPEPVHAGTPTEGFPLVWSVYRWIEGDPVGPETVRDWGVFGADLAAFVGELHGTRLMGASRTDGLSWYRGGRPAESDAYVGPAFEACRPLVGDELDVDALEGMWRDGLALPDSGAGPVWLHGDLRAANLLARDGRFHAVIDFGGLSIGLPDAEHAAVWDLPPEARQAYWEALDLDEGTWTRARAWAVAVAVLGIPYYWTTYPAFVTECRARLSAVLAAPRSLR
ncbi:aminoglycoside phosphotransferase family protein [Streptomyces sp. NPDC057682]|uniref:aminoglycoside phosphotransferase family protein n=1 Tax=Streptomyces sp. NPDC057682 TaxID=3346210 RepID=UPI00368EDFF9